MRDLIKHHHPPTPPSPWTTADVDPLPTNAAHGTPPLFVEPPPMDAADVERPPVDTGHSHMLLLSLPVIGPSPMDAAAQLSAPHPLLAESSPSITRASKPAPSPHRRRTHSALRGRLYGLSCLPPIALPLLASMWLNAGLFCPSAARGLSESSATRFLLDLAALARGFTPHTDASPIADCRPLSRPSAAHGRF
ncbi:hypothetical protein EDB84DRAFT_1564404 [Lactarius hengduanensis]|nr:hypothetical protein EDB84DRAFT_1564404 [Lactarius hengduanensis]